MASQRTRLVDTLPDALPAARPCIDVPVDVTGHHVVTGEHTASATPKASDGRHPTWLPGRLEGRLEGRLVEGIVFHTRPAPRVLDDQVGTLPIASLWARA